MKLNHHVFDTLYHALALETDGAVLVTADRRYHRKAKPLGSIAWLPEFICRTRGGESGSQPDIIEATTWRTGVEPTIDDSIRTQEAKKLATICYALYAISCFVGITAIAAIIINYIKRDDAAGTWVASHFEWQIKTFWYTLAGAFVGWLLMFVLIGFPILLVVGVWAIYRIVKGWLALYDGKPVDPTRLL